MTLTEKILAAHTDKRKVSLGEFINVRVDLILANDVTAPIAIQEFQRIGVDEVFKSGMIYPEVSVLIPQFFLQQLLHPQSEL